MKDSENFWQNLLMSEGREIYEITKNRDCLCFFVNTQENTEDQEKQALKDGQNLVSVFQRLGFDVVLYQGPLTYQEAKKGIRKKLENGRQKTKDIFAISLSCFGGTDDMIAFADRTVHIDDLLSDVLANEDLNDKPILIFVHICRWENDLDSQADMHNKYKDIFSKRQVRPNWLEFWTVGPYSDLFRQYNQPCPYITSIQTIMSPYGRKLNLLETLAVVIDNMAQTPALDLVNTDMGKVNLKNFVHLVHDLRKELRFYHVDEDDPAVIPFKVPNQSKIGLIRDKAKSTVLRKFAVNINTKLERSLDEGDDQN